MPNNVSHFVTHSTYHRSHESCVFHVKVYVFKLDFMCLKIFFIKIFVSKIKNFYYLKYKLCVFKITLFKINTMFE